MYTYKGCLGIIFVADDDISEDVILISATVASFN